MELTSMLDEGHKCEGYEEATVKLEGAYHDRLFGMPEVYLHGIEVINCTVCGKRLGTTYPSMGPMMDTAAAALCNKRDLLMPVEIRFLRKHMGVPAKKAARALRVTQERYDAFERGEIADPGLKELADHMFRLKTILDQDVDPNDARYCHPLILRFVAGRWFALGQ